MKNSLFTPFTQNYQCIQHMYTT